jgi:uncharacterized membrane protein YfcA
LEPSIALFVAIGFFAQMVDGALGMAYGVIASSSLIATGAPPAIASAAVHAAEMVTTALSGASHIWHRNVDRTLFLKLVVTGMLGGIVGAYVLTGLPEHIIKPAVTLYLVGMTVLIFARVLGWIGKRWHPPTPVIGAGGGFLDAVGGGGWGPIVASTLIAGGDSPRQSVGSVNLAEFFVTVSISITFFTQLDLARYGSVVIGLIIGGALAAPLAGYLLRVLRPRVALILVGAVVAALSIVNLVALFT